VKIGAELIAGADADRFRDRDNLGRTLGCPLTFALFESFLKQLTRRPPIAIFW